MKNQLVTIGIVALLVCVGLGGCYEQQVTKADADKFIGTWTCYEWWKITGSEPHESNKYTMIFYSNMSVKYIFYGLYEDESWDTWSVKDNICQLNWESEQMEPEYYSYIFTNDYKNLEMTKLDSGYKVVKLFLSK